MCTPMLTAALLVIAKVGKQPKCPRLDGWVKMWYIYVCTDYYSAKNQKEILPCVRTWRDLEGVMLNETRQTEKDKYQIISLTCAI